MSKIINYSIILVVLAALIGSAAYFITMDDSDFVTELDGMNFVMTHFNGDDVEDRGHFTLSFEDGRLGAIICNSMGGDYHLDNGVLTVPELIQTLMYCEEIMDVENAFSTAVGNGAQITIENGYLTMSGDDNEFIFSLIEEMEEEAANEEEEIVYCTADAMMCPDGSYVGRVPPSCEFAACPGNDLVE